MKNRNAKICYVANDDSFVKFLLLPQLKFLIKEGYDVYAVCTGKRWISDIEKEGVRVKNIKIKRKVSPFYDLITFFNLWNYFRKEKFDIVHVNNPKPGLLGQLAAKIAGVPIIVNTIHGFYFQKGSHFLKRSFFITIEKIAAKCSDLIFFVNREDMETALEEKICDSRLIKYFGGGINISRFNPERFSNQSINQKKGELNILIGYNVVGIVARLVYEKGYSDLFKALKAVLKVFPKTILLVLGRVEPEKILGFNPKVVENYGIEKNVIFLGEREDADEIYSLMDLFVLPSYREGIGISILEASAMKKPVISSNIRGCREAVDNSKTGFLVPVNNPEKIAEAIIYMLGNQAEKAKKMGENGRIKVIKEFDEKLVFDRIKKGYELLLKEKL